MKKILLSVFVLFVFNYAVVGQKSRTSEPTSKNTAKGDEKEYKNFSNTSFIEEMTEAINQGKELSESEQFTLANSYWNLGKYEDAEQWYSILVNENSDKMYKRRYAKVLQTLKKCDEAEKWYDMYLQETDASIDTDKQNLDCNELEKWGIAFNNPNIAITNVSSLNSEKYDFSPAYYKNGLAFVSNNNPEESSFKVIDYWLGDDFMNVYYSEKGEDETFGEIKNLSNKINTRFHEGPLSFTRDGQIMFFTRNNYRNKRIKDENGVISLKIYMSTYKNGEWSDAFELPFNDDSKIVCHPTITPDGQTLYFAADFDDSRGGLDLYVSHHIRGIWTKPINLGDDINTEANENFPFIHSDGTLYYASNRTSGFGGIDVYYSVPKKISGKRVTWEKAANLGKLINTRDDDFGLILDKDRQTGYFTSNREGSQSDDIYYFKLNSDEDPNTLPQINEDPNDLPPTNHNSKPKPNSDDVYVSKGVSSKNAEAITSGIICVRRADNNQLLGNTYIDVYEEIEGKKGKVLKYLQTDNEGYLDFDFKPNRKYTYRIERDGFKPTNYQFITTDVVSFSGADNQFCIPLEEETRNCQSIVGYTIDANTNAPIGNTTVTFQNQYTGVIQTIVSQDNGYFEMCIPCNAQFDMRASKSSYHVQRMNFDTRTKSCRTGNTEVRIPLHKGNIQANNANNNNNSTNSNSVLVDDDFELKEGAVIQLKRVFYHFNKYYIREDASVDLDHLVTIMKQYSTMRIELSSHTDSRGTTSYNKTLSQNRANSAKEYLVSKGISPHRIMAIGYGESRLENGCSDGVTCSKEQHQVNRRTEVKITYFEQNNVDLKVLKNAPRVID